MRSRWLTGGTKAKDFEEMFAGYIGVKHAIAVSSCTAALHLAMCALNIRLGDEVVVPDLTFAATANAPMFCGAKPVFADIDEETFNISPQDVMNRITHKTKAIIPVHYGGQPCNMKEILDIAEDHKLYVVEDCAHSLGAEYRGEKTGRLGVMGCFSFYPTKILTTLEGGMITTDDDRLARRLRILREHGVTKTALQREKDATWYYDIVDLGYNYRLNEVQAVLGISQLKRVEEGVQRRIDAARYYGRELDLNGLVQPYRAPNRTHIYHLYVIKVQKDEARISRDELFTELSRKGIETSVHYTPLHLMSFYKKLMDQCSKAFPVAEKVYEQILSLPLFPTITKKNIEFITQNIKNIIIHSR